MILQRLYRYLHLKGIIQSDLLETLKNYLPEGPKYYPDDQVTDHPERFIISEFIREKVLHLTREEIPHSIAVVIEQIKREEDGFSQYHGNDYC